MFVILLYNSMLNCPPNIMCCVLDYFEMHLLLKACDQSKLLEMWSTQVRRQRIFHVFWLRKEVLLLLVCFVFAIFFLSLNSTFQVYHNIQSVSLTSLLWNAISLNYWFKATANKGKKTSVLSLLCQHRCWYYYNITMIWTYYN